MRLTVDVTRHPSPAHSTNVGAEAGGKRREARVGARSARGLLVFPVSRTLSCGSGFQPRFLSRPGRGKMPLPQTRLQVAGCSSQWPVHRDPSPVTRLPHTPRMWEQRREEGGGRRGLVRAPRAAFWSFPSPVHCPVGAASSRDSSAALVAARCRSHKPGYRLRAAAHSGLYTVTRHPSPAHSTNVGAEAGGKRREARVGARSARGLLAFPVSRTLSCGSGFQPRFLSRPGRGKMPLPQGQVTGYRLQSAGCGLRFTVGRQPSTVTRPPRTPAKRGASAPHHASRL